MPPIPQRQVFNFAAGNVNIPNAAETVFGTTLAVSSPAPGSTFAILFCAILTTPALLTNTTIQVRRTGLTGTSIYNSGALSTAASTVDDVFVAVTDQLVGDVASAVWVVTATTAGGAAAATMANVFSSVIVSL